MTKEQLYAKWEFSSYWKSDIEAVIANEIEKAKVQPVLNPIGEPYETFVTLGYKKPQPALNPIAEAYERGEKIRHKNWLNGDWIQKHKETKTIDNHGNINSVYPFAFIQHPEKWELYTEPTEQQSSQVKLDNSFDKERFEAMFRAVVASGKNEHWEDDINVAKWAIEQLDAYYASKEKGGNNG